ncbi:MAG: HD family phosphohydrolase [Lachnospiraceae bacterium]|nr:HD family phosphohydrolase [Lachnospiraceae bacterium]
MNAKTIEKHNRRERFWDTFLTMRDDPLVQSLQEYPNHRFSNLYDHSSRVALCAYDLSRRLHWEVDGQALARGAMLHDFYLYHARTNKEISYKDHLFGHPAIALQNAREHFALSRKEENIITSHMWPLTFFHVPKSREAFLVQTADKICAFGEGVLHQTRVRQQHYIKKAEYKNEKLLARLVKSELRQEKKRRRKKYITLQ